jgi:hypothetical protein
MREQNLRYLISLIGLGPEAAVVLVTNVNVPNVLASPILGLHETNVVSGCHAAPVTGIS